MINMRKDILDWRANEALKLCLAMAVGYQKGRHQVTLQKAQPTPADRSGRGHAVLRERNPACAPGWPPARRWFGQWRKSKVTHQDLQLLRRCAGLDPSAAVVWAMVEV